MNLDYIQKHFYIENSSNNTDYYLYKFTLLTIVITDITDNYFTESFYMKNNDVTTIVKSQYENIGSNLSTSRYR